MPPPQFLVSTAFSVIHGREDVADTGFIYRFLSQDHIVEYLHAIGEQSSSVYPSIKPKDISRLQIRLPPLDEQRRIAHILGTLDDRIELNRRMNETLEEMARALFRSWFVDFDPVHAKAEGRATGLPPSIDALFPAAFVPSELGEIPAGWEVKPLGECFDVTMGQSPPGSTYNDSGEGLPFFQGRTAFGPRYPENQRFCSVPMRIAQANDTLLSVRAPVGDINMAWEECCIGRGVAALRHKSRSTSYTYQAVRALQPEVQQYEHTGTVFGAITRKQLTNLLTLDPPRAIIDGFERYGAALGRRIRAATAESRALAEQRDALLSPLLSGEAYVPADATARGIST